MIFRLLGLLNTNISNDTNIFSRGSYSVFNTHTDLTLFFYTHTDRTDFVRGGALTGGLNTRLFWTRIKRIARIIFFARGGAERNVDFWMLNVELLRLAAMWNCSMMNIDAHMVAIERERERYEWDKYGFNTGGVNPHCLCSVLKLESLYSFSPTIGKQACFAHDLSKKFQIFAAVHKSNVLNSATKLILSNLSPNLSASLLAQYIV